jgi:hypothetical protein
LKKILIKTLKIGQVRLTVRNNYLKDKGVYIGKNLMPRNLTFRRGYSKISNEGNKVNVRKMFSANKKPRTFEI